MDRMHIAALLACASASALPLDATAQPPLPPIEVIAVSSQTPPPAANFFTYSLMGVHGVSPFGDVCWSTVSTPAGAMAASLILYSRRWPAPALCVASWYSNPAPGTTALWESQFPGGIASDGRVVFAGVLRGGGVDLTNNQGLWIGTETPAQRVYRRGEPAPSLGGPTLASLSVVVRVASDASFAHQATLAGPTITAANDQVVYTSTNSVLNVWLREGDPAPDGLPGTIGAFSDASGARVARGGVTILSTQSSLAGPVLWYGPPGQIVAALRASQQLPGLPAGQTVTQVLASALGDDGTLAFGAATGGPLGARRGVWLGRPGSMRLVANSNTPTALADGSPATFTELSPANYPPSMYVGPRGRLAFLALARNAHNQTVLGLWRDPGPGAVASPIADSTTIIPGTTTVVGEIDPRSVQVDGAGNVAFQQEAPSGGAILSWSTRTGLRLVIGPGDTLALDGGSITIDSVALAESASVGGLSRSVTDDGRLGVRLRDNDRADVVALVRIPGTCQDIDFNNDGVFPDIADAVAFVGAFGGGDCTSPTSPTTPCDSIDFNTDGVSPDLTDLTGFLRVFSGGPCDE
jgi:hypothetical protein